MLKGFVMDDERLKQGKTLFDKDYSNKTQPIESDFDKVVKEIENKR